MEITISHPEKNSSMWRWIISVIMIDWLGMKVDFDACHGDTIVMYRDGKSLEISCCFLLANNIRDIRKEKFPALPLSIWSCPIQLNDSLRALSINELPILFGDSGFEITAGGSVKLGLDVFGSAFFMLSRYEELPPTDLDDHGRYSGATSFSNQAKLLNRPIIDEYLNILIASMKLVWPILQPKNKCGETIVSCDVDEPFERWIRDPIYLAKGIAGALVRRKSLSIAGRRLMNGIFSQFGNYIYDPYWNFDWYMDVCEAKNKRAYFYFLANPGPRNVDAAYRLESKRMQRLLASIHSRGHIIGLHGSYDSYINAELLVAERQKLQNACEAAGANQEILHSRQHYLRWQVDATPDNQAKAGLKFDSTVGFADLPGFRCGTSRKFKMWSWKKLEPLDLEQQPLVLMEGSLISGVYLPLSNEVESIINVYKDRSLRTGGSFMFLWHNSNLTNERDKQLFQSAVQ